MDRHRTEPRTDVPTAHDKSVRAPAMPGVLRTQSLDRTFISPLDHFELRFLFLKSKEPGLIGSPQRMGAEGTPISAARNSSGGQPGPPIDGE